MTLDVPLTLPLSFSLLFLLITLLFPFLVLSFVSMGFFVDDPGLIVTHLLHRTAVVLTVLRWFLSWVLSFKDIRCVFTNTFSSDSQDNSSSASLVCSQMIRDGLALTTFEDAKERMPWVSDTCAVCLSRLKEVDEVRELRNCCHVFHRDCIDRWVDYDQDQDLDYDHDHDLDYDHDHNYNDLEGNHRTCPLCRAPLLTSTQTLGWPKHEPSWAVQHLLYLFGDDLLP